MDYNTLVSDKTTPGSVMYSINYDRIDSAGIVAEAEAYIYSKLRVREMRSSAELFIATGASNVAYPSDYRDPIHLGIPGYINRIARRELEWFRTHLGYDETAALPTGMPTLWTDDSGLIQFNSLADIDYTAVFKYYKTPTPLSPGNPTNFLTAKYPTMLRRACLMFAAEARKEYDTFDREEARVLAQIEEIKVEGDLEMRGMELDFNWEGTGDGDSFN